MTSTISSGTTSTTGSGIVPGSNYAIGNNGNLSQDHPVDIQYPTNDPTYWAVTVTTQTSGTGFVVTFNDTAYPYGHPGQLFSTDGTTAWIECGSCHNPHAWLNAVAPTPSGPTAVPTAMFLRGQYRDPSDLLAFTTTNPAPSNYTSANYTTDNANFCMSCHSYPSSQFTGTVH
jgi:hypothetical protein